ncbi:DUF1453 domain-containing protein [Bacillus sp. NPDC094106]|uniref:DUF1453 domain-containing protein n=1 Tax=Bacillus sp. NPDC094106 TaxID=3363949 RepID=UPI00380F4111
MDIILVILIIVLLQGRERKVKVNRLWLVPALLLYVTVQSIFHMGALTLWESIIFLTTFLIGLGLGVVRGRLLTFRLDSETGHVLRKGNWVSSIFLLVILGAKIFIKQSMFFGNTHYALTIVTNAFLCMTLGTIISRRYYIWRKYQELTSKG